MIDAVFAIERDAARREVHLDAYLDAAAEERATIDAIAWIKSLRDARVDGQRLRQRFTFRGDSLWWFAELYCKQQVMTTVFRALTAPKRSGPRASRRCTSSAAGASCGPNPRWPRHGHRLSRPGRFRRQPSGSQR
jgi:hypothetical protein